MTFIERLLEITPHVLEGADALPYGQDWVGKYPSTPLAVVRPKTTQEVSAILALCNETNTAVVPMGGNTGLTGATRAEGALILSLERMNQIRDLRPKSCVAIVEAGVVLQNLQAHLEGSGLKYPMTFGARGTCQIGGNLATNAGGSNVLRYGTTRDLCLGIEVVLADGRVLDLMSELHKDNSGYDLRNLMIGSEGTLGIITAAALKLAPEPRAYATAMVQIESTSLALDLLNTLQNDTGNMVEAFEYMPRDYMARLRQYRPDLPPPFAQDADHCVLIELGSTVEADCVEDETGTSPLAQRLEDTLGAFFEQGHISDAAIAASQAQRVAMWEMREAAAEISTNTKPLLINDLCLPLERVSTFLESAPEHLKRVDPKATSCTVSHLGDGNIHYTVYPSVADEEIADALVEAIEALVEELGGSFSAEHGIGLSKLNSMARRKPTAVLDTMRSLKHALDPNNIMNPGKLLP